jgi:hypothetical protein
MKIHIYFSKTAKIYEKTDEKSMSALGAGREISSLALCDRRFVREPPW